MLFVIDFDGTLAVDDTVDRLLEHYADPSWASLEADWLAGRITALECMGAQIGLVNADQVTLERFFRGIELDPHFPAFWDHVRPYAQVAVVSDGLDHAIHTALRGAGLDLPVFANTLHFVGRDRLELSFPLRQTDCAGGNGVCKCAVARDLAKASGGPVVLIGDGKSDACLAARADIVFAKSSLLRHCQEQAIPHTPFEDFSDILRIVQAWSPAGKLPAIA